MSADRLQKVATSFVKDRLVLKDNYRDPLSSADLGLSPQGFDVNSSDREFLPMISWTHIQDEQTKQLTYARWPKWSP